MVSEGNSCTETKTIDLDPKREMTCKLCNVKCQGIISYRAHIEGRPHYNVLARLDQSKSETNGPPPTKKMKLSTTINQHRCETCEVNCSSEEEYQIHIKGSRHNKRLKEAQSEEVVKSQTHIKELPDNGGFECTICSVVMNAKSVVESHIKGSKHQKKVRAESASVAGTSLATPSIECKSCKVFLNTDEQLQIHSQSPKHKRKEEAMTRLTAMGAEYLL